VPVVTLDAFAASRSRFPSWILMDVEGWEIAALRGAEWLTPDDVKAVAPPVLRHRLVLRPEAELAGATPDELVDELLGTIPVPR